MNYKIDKSLSFDVDSQYYNLLTMYGTKDLPKFRKHKKYRNGQEPIVFEKAYKFIQSGKTVDVYISEELSHFLNISLKIKNRNAKNEGN